MDNFEVIFVNILSFLVYFFTCKLCVGFFSTNFWSILPTPVNSCNLDCFLLFFLKLFAANSLLVTYVMTDHLDFSHTNCLRVSFFQQKVDHFWILLTSIKICYLKLLLSFLIIFTFSHMYIVCWGLMPWTKGFTSVSLLPFTKN